MIRQPTVNYDMSHALIAGPQGKWILCTRTSSESLGDFAWVWRRSCEESSKVAIIVRQMNSVPCFLRQISGLTLSKTYRRRRNVCVKVLATPRSLMMRPLFFLNSRYWRKPDVVALTFGKLRSQGTYLVAFYSVRSRYAGQSSQSLIKCNHVVSAKGIHQRKSSVFAGCFANRRQLTSFPGTPGLPGSPSKPTIPWPMKKGIWLICSCHLHADSVSINSPHSCVAWST